MRRGIGAGLGESREREDTRAEGPSVLWPSGLDGGGGLELCPLGLELEFLLGERGDFGPGLCALAVFGEGVDAGEVEGLVVRMVAVAGAPALVVEATAEDVVGDGVDGEARPGDPAVAVDVFAVVFFVLEAERVVRLDAGDDGDFGLFGEERREAGHVGGAGGCLWWAAVDVREGLSVGYGGAGGGRFVDGGGAEDGCDGVA